MFGLSFSEILLAGIVALVVLGPERLPKAARTLGQWVGKIQRLAANVKSELETQAEYAELAKLKKEVSEAAQELKDGMKDLENHLAKEADEIRDLANVPPWERLPEQRTPADFGIDEHSNNTSFRYGIQTKSIHKQAMSRKRDTRPRYRPKPKLRSRR